MARKPKSSLALISAAENVIRETRDARELRRAQTILLPSMDLSLAETGQIIGRSKASVTRLRAQFSQATQRPEGDPLPWGGRRRQNLSIDEERAFLAPFFEQAKVGGILVVAPIKAAYERTIARGVPDSTVYRLLARHGWRKIAPGKHHPKNNPGAQEEWKKNSPQC